MNLVPESVGDARLEWGGNGLEHGLASAAAVVIVDVLSFSTAIDIAVGRGGLVFPYRGEAARDFAQQHHAILASRDRHAGFSLAPASLTRLIPGTRLVLPSPNGSMLSLGTGAAPTYCGCLRNAQAVAQAAAQHGAPVLVVAAGERWPDRSLRPATEDLLGAGAIIHYLPGTRSPDAALAEAAFLAARHDLLGNLQRCPSGLELIGLDCAEDVALAAQLNISPRAPRLHDGAYS